MLHPVANRQVHLRYRKFYRLVCHDLILYVRHGAWLTAVPDEGSSGQESPRAGRSKARPRSRLQRLRNQFGEEFQPEMPPLLCGEHMLDYLEQAGPTAGDSAIGHPELAAFQANTGIELTEWEASTLRLMSKALVAESHRATEADCLPPWGDAREARVLKALATRDAMRNLANL